MAAIPPQLPLRLDATPLGRPLYERHGFVLETSLTRHVPAGRALRRRSPNGVVRLPSADLQEVAGRSTRRSSGASARGCSNAFTPRGPSMRGAPAVRRSSTASGAKRPPVRSDWPDRREHGSGTAIALGAAPHCPTRTAQAVVVDAYDEHEDFTAWLRLVWLRGAAAALPDAAAGLGGGCTGHGCPHRDRVRDSRAGVRMSRRTDL